MAWRVEKMIKYALHVALPFQGPLTYMCRSLPKKHDKFHL